MVFSSRLIKVLSGIYLFLFYDFFQLDMMNEVSAHLQHLLALSSTQLGIVNSLFFYVNFVLLIPAGFLLDKHRPRDLVVISLIINAVSQIIFILYPHYESALLWRAGAGVAGAFSYLTALKVLSDNFSHKNLGALIGFSGLSIMLSGIVAQSPLGMVLQEFGLMHTLVMNAIFSIMVMVVVAWLLTDSYFNKTTARLADDLLAFRKMLRSYETMLTALFAGLINMPLFILGASWGIIYLTSQAHINTAQAAIATSALFVGDIIGAPIMGYISDRFLSRIELMIIGSCFNLLALLSIGLINSPFVIVVLFFIIGFTCTAQTPAYAHVIELNERRYAARASSIISAISLGLIALAEPLIGFIVELTKTHEIIILMLTTTSMMTLFIGFILKNTRK